MRYCQPTGTVATSVWTAKVEFYGALYASVNSTPTEAAEKQERSRLLSNVLVCWWERVGVVSSDLLSLGPRTTPTQRRDEITLFNSHGRAMHNQAIMFSRNYVLQHSCEHLYSLPSRRGIKYSRPSCSCFHHRTGVPQQRRTEHI